jgi:Kef-type K+ transport system membrane component KefB/nucleotide-binding universal stress UspA family protein
MKVASHWIWLWALSVLTGGPAWAAEGGKGASEAIFIGQIVVLMVVGRLLGEAMLRLRQPAVMGQLIAGLILGPCLFGLLLPDLQHALFPKTPEQKAMIDAISQFGILLLLLLTGMETDLKLVRQTGRASLFASLMGIVIPFVCGFVLGEMLPDGMLPDPQKRLITSLFLGTALSIASVKIVAMVVREMNFVCRVVGQVILASAIIDDSIGWIIVSIIFSLALHGSIEPIPLAQSIVGTVLFMVASLTIGRRLVFFVIRWVNDYFVSEFAVITAILVVMGIMALITHMIGVHTVLGAFVAGILVGESPILTRHIDEQLRGLITAFFAPVFFGIAGLSADLTVLADPEIALFTAGLVLVASLGKFGGAFLGAELGGLTRREGFALNCGMNARGSTEVIIATVGLSIGALNQNLFTMIVAMAVLTTMAMPPTLRWALSRIPMRKEEKQRLEREELEQRGFVSNLERLLVAVDDSPNGKFALRTAGVLAGTHGMPATVLHVPDPSKIESTMPEYPANMAAGAAKSSEKTPDQKRSNGREDSKKTNKVDEKTEKEEKKAEDAADAVQQVAAQIKDKQKKEDLSGRQAEHSHPGQRHRAVAARGGSCHHPGARGKGASHRPLRRGAAGQPARHAGQPPPRRGHPQGHRCDRGWLQHQYPHGGRSGAGRQRGDRRRAQAPQSQSSGAGRRPPTGRKTFLRRHRGCVAREIGALAVVRGELRNSLRVPTRAPRHHVPTIPRPSPHPSRRSCHCRCSAGCGIYCF